MTVIMALNGAVSERHSKCEFAIVAGALHQNVEVSEPIKLFLTRCFLLFCHMRCRRLNLCCELKSLAN